MVSDRAALLGTTLVLTLSLAACDDVELNQVAPAALPEWTVMVYMAADNNLSVPAIENLDQMEAAGVSERVRVVIQAEFSPRFLAAVGCDASCFNRPNFNTFRYVITGEGEDTPGPDGPAIDLGNRNMTDPAELREFVQWVQANHPARRYLVILWDHGGGYSGLLSDETSAPQQAMQLRELPVAFAGLRFDVLDFDMCLMGAYETLANVGSVASQVVFSQELVPGQGLPYTQLLTSINADPTLDARQMAMLLVEEYDRFYSGGEFSTTLSAYTTAGFPAFESALGALATELRAELPALGPTVASAAAASQRYYLPETKDLVDLLDSLSVRLDDPTLESRIASVRARAIDPSFRLRSTFNNGTEAGENDVSRSNGLSIVLPSGQAGDRFETSGDRSFANYQAQMSGRPWTSFLGQFVAGQPTDPGGTDSEGNGHRCNVR